MKRSKTTRNILNRLPLILFGFSVSVLIFLFGLAVAKYEIFPYSQIKDAEKVAKELLNRSENKKPWYYPKTDFTKKLVINRKLEADSTLLMFSSMSENNDVTVKVIDLEGKIVHEWKVDWFKIWPDPSYLPDEVKPKSKPGFHIHGMLLLENGDLIINIDGLSLVRLNPCGEVVWKLPYRTHHSIYRDENDNLWVPGIKCLEEPSSDYPNFNPPINLYTILKVSMQGEILTEINLVDLFVRNNLQGLLYMPNITDGSLIKVTGDILHLNDIEVFPSSMEEGVFKSGDIMVSLRNINTVIIFNGGNLRVRYMIVGGMVRQHDPDFIDGNTISIFDNNNIFTEDNKKRSRILIHSAKTNKSQVYYEGDEENPFFSFALGKHQWLPNGNLLITESMRGRIFEVDSLGNIVWEYINIVEDGYAGLVEEAQQLSPQFSKSFFEQTILDCGSAN